MSGFDVAVIAGAATVSAARQIELDDQRTVFVVGRDFSGVPFDIRDYLRDSCSAILWSAMVAGRNNETTREAEERRAAKRAHAELDAEEREARRVGKR